MRRPSLVASAMTLLLFSVTLTGCQGVEDALFTRVITANFSSAPPPIDGMRVVVCGSASPLGNLPERAQACIAVLTEEHFFLFDVGARSPLRLAQAQMPMGRLDGVFLTHFHSDHISGVPDVNLVSWVQGRGESLPIFGGPGVEEVVSGFNTAYVHDQRYRVAHHGPELLNPTAAPMTATSFTPGEAVFQDDLVTVTSFLQCARLRCTRTLLRRPRSLLSGGRLGERLRRRRLGHGHRRRRLRRRLRRSRLGLGPRLG